MPLSEGTKTWWWWWWWRWRWSKNHLNFFFFLYYKPIQNIKKSKRKKKGKGKIQQTNRCFTQQPIKKQEKNKNTTKKILLLFLNRCRKVCLVYFVRSKNICTTIEDPDRWWVLNIHPTKIYTKKYARVIRL